MRTVGFAIAEMLSDGTDEDAARRYPGASAIALVICDIHAIARGLSSG